jgi:hypothetical protein
MQKINLAIQHWDESLNWWLPNTIPSDYTDKHNLPTHGQQWCLTGLNDFLSWQENLGYVALESVVDEKFIFPIIIRSSHYFQRMEHTGFQYVDQRVFDAVAENRCKIVFVFPFEGNTGFGYFENDLKILNRWCIERGLNKEQVYFVHANLTPVTDLNFTMIGVNSFLCWVKEIHDSISNFEPATDSNLFLNYNRRSKVHRAMMTAYLVREGLLHRGLVSYHGDNLKNTKLLLPEHLHNEAEVIDSFIPKEIDMDLAINNPAQQVSLDHYKLTFLSVISETHTDPGMIFFSEKIWKTIGVGHPFMIVGNPGTLNKLREMGYQTFMRWWDESYDEVEDLEIRIRMITNELKRLSSLSVTELKQLRAEIDPVLVHNQKMFNQQWEDCCSLNNEVQLEKIIKGIWSSF